jgi:hypothetical protein
MSNDLTEMDEIPAAGPASGATPIKATNINTNLRLKALKRIKEQMSVGAGVIAGMPTADPPELTPVGTSTVLRRKKLLRFKEKMRT